MRDFPKDRDLYKLSPLNYRKAKWVNCERNRGIELKASDPISAMILSSYNGPKTQM